MQLCPRTDVANDTAADIGNISMGAELHLALPAGSGTLTRRREGGLIPPWQLGGPGHRGSENRGPPLSPSHQCPQASREGEVQLRPCTDIANDKAADVGNIRTGEELHLALPAGSGTSTGGRGGRFPLAIGRAWPLGIRELAPHSLPPIDVPEPAGRAKCNSAPIRTSPTTQLLTSLWGKSCTCSSVPMPVA